MRPVSSPFGCLLYGLLLGPGPLLPVFSVFVALVCDSGGFMKLPRYLTTNFHRGVLRITGTGTLLGVVLLSWCWERHGFGIEVIIFFYGLLGAARTTQAWTE